jgi:hypothetical protein
MAEASSSPVAGSQEGNDVSSPQTPWERVSASRRSRRSEDQAARSDGGRRQPASGALRGQRGDVRTDEWLIEDKFTDAESFSIKLTMLKKTIHEALVTGGRLPMWRIVIQGHRFRLLREEDYLWLKAQVDDNANTH